MSAIGLFKQGTYAFVYPPQVIQPLTMLPVKQTQLNDYEMILCSNGLVYGENPNLQEIVSINTNYNVNFSSAYTWSVISEANPQSIITCKLKLKHIDGDGFIWASGARDTDTFKRKEQLLIGKGLLVADTFTRTEIVTITNHA